MPTLTTAPLMIPMMTIMKEATNACRHPPKPTNDMWKKPAADHPDWPWVTTWQSWTIFCDFSRRVSYCDPDNFNMYICGDSFVYGVQELIANLVSPVVLFECCVRVTDLLSSLSCSMKLTASRTIRSRKCGPSLRRWAIGCRMIMRWEGGNVRSPV
jgi:hypothetical protein